MYHKEQNWILETDQRLRNISTYVIIIRLPINTVSDSWPTSLAIGNRVAIDDKRSSHDETLSIKEELARKRSRKSKFA